MIKYKCNSKEEVSFGLLNAECFYIIISAVIIFDYDLTIVNILCYHGAALFLFWLSLYSNCTLAWSLAMLIKIAFNLILSKYYDIDQDIESDSIKLGLWQILTKKCWFYKVRKAYQNIKVNRDNTFIYKG